MEGCRAVPCRVGLTITVVELARGRQGRSERSENCEKGRGEASKSSVLGRQATNDARRAAAEDGTVEAGLA